MDEEKMTVTRGLVELKLLDKKIRKKINTSRFVGNVKGNKTHTMDQDDKKEFSKEGKKAEQSIRDMIERRRKIKAAIVQSNATTNVRIFKKEYTVADAIERKNSIEYEQAFISAIKSQISDAEETMNVENMKMETKLENLLTHQVGGENKKTQDAKEFIKAYKELNECTIYDPGNLRKKIEQMGEDLDNFLAEVDQVLSESNATTFIAIY
jgi:hypothetical protein